MFTPRMIKVATWAGVTLAMLGIFNLYIRPDFLLTLANQVWGCF